MRFGGTWGTRGRGLATLALAGFLAACERPSPPPNFLLLSIDTLRADHLGSYGYPRDTSPNLDRFAAESVRYANAFAPAPWTLPSHVAMLAGRHPYGVGIVDTASSIPGDVALLAEELSVAGYQTAAFVDSVSGGLLGAERGFSRGFDFYRHAPHDDASPYRYDMATTADVGLAWLTERDPARPFFLFLHTKSVHTAPADPQLLARSDAPYQVPSREGGRFLEGGELRFPWRAGPEIAGVRYLQALNERIAAGRFDRLAFPRARLDELVGLYDAGIFYVDLQFAGLLQGLRALGVEDDTVVIVTADHGEAFLDYLFFLHKELRPPLLRVPLMVHDPERPAAVVAERVALADIPTSVLERAGLAIPEGMTGRPLPTGPRASDPPRAFLSYYRFRERYFYEAYALLDGPWKLVYQRLARAPDFRADLYDTRSDPEERSPVTDAPERTRAMLARLKAWIAAPGESRAERIELDARTREELRVLGYLD